VAKLLNKKYQAYSLVESLVSLAIVAILIAICSVFFAQFQAYNSTLNDKANVIMQEQLDKLKQEKTFTSNEIEKEDFKINIRCAPYNNIENLVHIEMQLKHKTGKVYDKDYLIIIDDL